MKISRFLYYLDLYRYPVTLLTKRPEETSTYSGKIFTCVIIAYFIGAFFLSNFINKTNPATTIQNLDVSYSKAPGSP